MNEAKPLKRKILIAAAGIVLVVGMIGLALKLDLLTTPNTTVDGPRQTVTFKDGGKLEIFGVSVGERVVDVAPRKWSLLRYFSGKGSSVRTFSGGTFGGLQVSTESENGKVIRCRMLSDSPTAMLMEFRMTEINGSEMTLTRNEECGNNPTSPFFFQPKNDSVAALVAEMVNNGLYVLIQHRDPQSGWINFIGPSKYHQKGACRYIAALSAWPRHLRTLECRAIRADGEVAEFSLVNPDYRKSPLPGAARAVPQVHSGGDYTMTARLVERFANLGEHPFSRVELDFLSGGKQVVNHWGSPLSFDGGTVEDEWGNVVKFEQRGIRNKTLYGAFLPASSNRMTVHLTVIRTLNSPRNSTTGYPVLEGVVSPDGLGVEFKPLPDAAQFGITRMPEGRINRVGSEWNGNVPKDWKELSLYVSGEAGSKQFEPFENRIGKLGQWHCLIFAEGSSESGGILDNYSGRRRYGNYGGRSNFDENVIWQSPPAMLIPGAKIRVGIHWPPKNDDVRFDLELPALIQPR